MVKEYGARAANGDMLGDIVAVKYTLDCAWPPLSREETAMIDKAVSPAFFDVTFNRSGKQQYSNKKILCRYAYISCVQLCAGSENICRR